MMMKKYDAGDIDAGGDVDDYGDNAMLNLLPLEGDRCLLLYLHLLAIPSHKLKSENRKPIMVSHLLTQTAI